MDRITATAAYLYDFNSWARFMGAGAFVLRK